MSEGPVALSLDDPEPLRQALDALRGDNAESMVVVDPVSRPLVERKGLLGRVKTAPAPWQVGVVSWSDRDGSYVFDLSIDMPEGAALSQRWVPLPPGATITADGTSSGGASLAEGYSPLNAAVVVCALVRATMEAAVPSGFQVGTQFVE